VGRPSAIYFAAARFARFFAGVREPVVRIGVSAASASSPRSTARRSTTERESLPTTKMSLLLRSAGIKLSARWSNDFGKRSVTMLESAIGPFLRDVVSYDIANRVLSRRLRGRAFASGWVAILVIDASALPSRRRAKPADNTTMKGKRALIVCSM
jgi:hypothetical protein